MVLEVSSVLDLDSVPPRVRWKTNIFTRVDSHWLTVSGWNLDLCMLIEGPGMDLVPTLFIVTLRSSTTLFKANVEGLIILGMAVGITLVLELPGPDGVEKTPLEERGGGVAELGRSKVIDELRSCLTATEIDDVEISW